MSPGDHFHHCIIWLWYPLVSEFNRVDVNHFFSENRNLRGLFAFADNKSVEAVAVGIDALTTSKRQEASLWFWFFCLFVLNLSPSQDCQNHKGKEHIYFVSFPGARNVKIESHLHKTLDYDKTAPTISETHATPPRLRQEDFPEPGEFKTSLENIARHCLKMKIRARKMVPQVKWPLPPNLTTRIQSIGYTWWKDRTNSCKLSLSPECSGLCNNLYMIPCNG